MKICVVSGFIISAPWVFYQIWMFVAAGLYPHERRYVRTAVPLCVGLFIAGVLFFVFIIAPISLEFFVRFGELIGVVPLWMFQRYVSFMAIMALVFGAGFQTPIAVFGVYKLGLVSIESLKSKRKFALFAAFAVAAIATPSLDVFSQVALAVPLYLLYEFGIILCQISRRRAGRSRPVSA
jgi:sec-independent protein translocase protein TatC